MGTGGIAAGGAEVMNAFKRQLKIRVLLLISGNTVTSIKSAAATVR
jgi:hypothetical protein